MKAENERTRKLLNRAIHKLLKDALAVVLRDPAQIPLYTRAVVAQYRAAGRRKHWEGRGVHVPPYLLVSVTNACNLRCAGCYAHAHGRAKKPEMSAARFREMVMEARDLGVGFVVLMGGEPLTRPDLIAVTAEFPDLIFAVFTNGLLLNDGLVAAFARQRNVVTFLSLEGDAAETDARRGEGVYERLRALMGRLQRARVFWGVSLTTTRANVERVTARPFVRDLVARGCKFFFYVEYIPVEEATDELVVTAEQRAALLSFTRAAGPREGAVFFSFPGDEEASGGCLSAGRGFVHVSAALDLEPCPFAPWSDMNLREVSLKHALKSRFLSAIRADHDKLAETAGGCALWANRAWVASLLK